MSNFFPGGLLPVRVDVELEDRRLQDSFLWNVSEPDSVLTEFVTQLVKELDLPDSYVAPVLHSVQAQVTELRELHVQLRDRSTWNVAHAEADAEEDEEEDEGNAESLHLIRLRVRVNNLLLEDQFYWDVSNPHADPDSFARGLCRDLQITDSEAPLAVSMALREQLLEIGRQLLHQRGPGRPSKSRRRGSAATAALEASLPSRVPRGVSLMSLLTGSHRRPRPSILRHREQWSAFTPSVESLVDEAKTAAELKDLRRTRFKRRHEERD